MEEFNKELKLISMEDIQTRVIEWLWYPRIPFGKITIMEGDPGGGKTTAIIYLAALLSKGLPLPLDDAAREPVCIIYQTAEDGLEDTIKPRLEKAGADCNKILVIDESKNQLSMSDERLEEAIKQTGARLLILDPIQGYIGAEVDMHRANEIRPILKKLGLIAEKYNCAIVLIGHMNKANGAKSTYRGLGSIDFQAAARSVLVVGRPKDNPNVRILAHDKSSLAPEGKPIAFEINEEEGLKWLGYYDITVDELLSGSTQESKLERTERTLKDLLAKGGVPQKEIIQKTSIWNISKRTLDEAKKNLGVKSYKNDGDWYWRLNN